MFSIGLHGIGCRKQINHKTNLRKQRSRNYQICSNYYASTAIKNILLFQRGDSLWTSESDVYGRQILTSMVGPRTSSIKDTIIAVCLWCIQYAAYIHIINHWVKKVI